MKRVLPLLIAWLASALVQASGQTVTNWTGGGSGSNWTTAGNWDNGVPNTPNGIAQFNAHTATAPTINSNTSLGQIVFVSGSDAESFTGSRTLTLNGVSGLGIGNQTGLTQTFANKFALGADQTWQSTANGGGLTFNGTVNLNGKNLTLGLASSGSSTITFAGNVSGTGSSLTIGGNGTTILTATASYTGPTTINSGAMLQTSGSGTLASTTNMTVNAGGTYDLNGISDTIASIAGAGNIHLGAATLTTSGSASTVFSGVISDSGAGGALNKSGTGTLTLSGANTFAGGVVLNAGSLEVGHDSALGTGTLDLSGGTLTATANYTLANNLTMTGNSKIAAGPGVSLVFTSNIIAPASNTLTLDNTTNAGTHLSVGFAGSGGSFNFSRPIAFDDDATDLAFLNTTGVQTFSGIISGAGNLVRNGTGGTTLLSASNTFTGNVTLAAGTLQISADNRLGAAPGAPTADKIVVDGGALNTTASFTLNSNRGVALNSGGGTFLPDSGTTLTYSGIMAGAGGFTQAGAGSFTLGGVNTQTGATVLTTGTLTVNAGAAISDASAALVVNGGTLNFNNAAQTISSLSGSGGTVNLASGHTLTVNDTGADTYSGVIASSGNFVKAGSGNLSLSGASTFSGKTSVQDGTLTVGTLNSVSGGTGISNLGAPTTVANGTIDLGSGANTGTLAVASGSFQITDRVINLAGTTGGGTVDASGAGGVAFTSNLTATGAGAKTFTLQGSGIASAFGGAIVDGAGTTALTKDGAGTWTLNGSSSNTFTGPTAIDAGTLVLAKTGSATAVGGNINVGNGTGTATLRLGGNNQIASTSAVTLASSGVFDVNGFTATIRTLGGLGLLDLGAAGTGQLTLSGGVSTFSGTFNGSGTIVIGAGATLAFGANFSAPNINLTLAGGTLALNGTTSTFGLLNITSNSVIDFGSSTASVLTVNNVAFQNTGLALSVNNWADLSDFFYARNFTGATPNVRGATPQNQVAFTGFSSSNTAWQSWDHQITPAPEPTTYGAIFMMASLALVLWRRQRRSA